ncbi:MAG: hypothetical protein CL920_16225 [Deltaproteobacteria bacterium]|nr:hypothetical protein [Deltaproteobacteria bacterium]MBU50235.1 hypothetical protein [Deltaproteobacteria bacterium]
MLTHLRRNPWMYALLLTFSLLAGCGDPNTGTDAGDKTCETSGDCLADQRCQRGKCIAKEQNVAPVAEAGDDKTGKTKKRVDLDGSTSYDDDGDNLTYKWSFSSKPENSQATLEKADTPYPYFTPDVAGDYVVALVVNDSNFDSEEDTITITVEKGVNKLPEANAGSDQTVAVGATVNLDGSKSSDPDDDKLTFKWKFTPPTGSKAVLSDETAEKPTFDADIAGKYELELTVNDGEADCESPAKITVTAVENLDKVPVLTQVDPAQGPAGLSSFDIKLIGKDFADGAVLLFQNREVSTTFVSGTELTASVDLSGVTPGKYPMKVKNPNQKESSSVDFEVIDIPTPKITKLLPASAGQNAKFTIGVEGTGFVQGAKIYFTGTELVTKYISPTKLEGEMDLAGTQIGSYPMYVRNPGAKTSDPSNFTVTVPPPPPEITLLNPEFGKSGTKIDFTVFGKNYQGAKIIFDGKEIPTKNPTPGELQADPKLDLTGIAGGSYEVKVRNFDGSTSTPINFTVLDQYPTPNIATLSPAAGEVDSVITVTIAGRWIDKAATVLFNNKAAKSTTFVSDKEIKAEFDTTGLTANQDYPVAVENPGPNGTKRKSNTLLFKAKPLPPPSITSITSTPLHSESAGVITVKGIGFTPSTVVQISNNGTRSTSTTYCRLPTLQYTSASDQPTKFINSTTLEVTVAKLPKVTSTTYDYYGIRVRRGTQYSNIRCVYVNYYAPTAPRLTSISPVAIVQGSTSPTRITVSGSYFNTYSKIHFGGKEVKTVYSSSSRLYYDFDHSTAMPGVFDVQVVNSTGLKSAVFKFTLLKKGQPLISSVSPTSLYAGDKINVTLNGSGFDSKAVVHIDGKATTFTTTYKSPTQVVLESAVFTIAQKGAVALTVVNPGTPPVNSNPISVTVLLRTAPRLTTIYNRSLSNSTVNIEEGSTPELEFYGDYYRTGAQAELGKTNPKLFPCHYIYSDSRLKCHVDVSGLPRGTVDLRIMNPDGQYSPYKQMTIIAPTPPTLTSIDPGVGYNNRKYTVTLKGTRFSKSSQVLVGTKVISTITFVSATEIKVEADLNGLPPRSLVSFKVRNVVAGTNYDSNAVDLIVLPPPTPLITYISPGWVHTGGKRTITLYGTDLDATSQLTFNGKAVTTKSITKTSIQVEVDLTGVAKGQYAFQAVADATRKSKLAYLGVEQAASAEVTYVNPTGVNHTTSTVPVTVYGKNFDPSATVTLGGLSVNATITATTIKFSISFPAALFPNGQPIPLVITNPGAAATTFNMYAMDASHPAIAYVSPRTVNPNTYTYVYAYAGTYSKQSSSDLLYINNTSYSRRYYSTYIRTYYSSTYRSPTTPGKVKVELRRGTNISNPVYFTVGTSSGKLTYAEPAYGKVGQAVTLKVKGTGFTTSPAAQLFIDGVKATGSVSVASTQLQTTFTPSKAGVIAIHVLNGDGKKTKTVYFNAYP